MLDRLNALRQVIRDAALCRADLEGVVRKRLQAVLCSARLHVPYYRELMRAAGYDPLRDFSGPGDLASLPITTKQVLRQRDIRELVEEGSVLTRCFQDRTSGSTGIPLTIYRDSHERSVQIAKWLRVLFANGYSITDRVMSLTGPTRLSEGRSFLQHFGILRRLAVDYCLPPERLVDALLDYGPQVVYGGRSFLDLMGLELDHRGARPEGLKLVIGTNEVIRESSRELCRRSFGIEMTESYGSVEMGIMAYETPEHDGLRLCEDLTFFEFLDDHGKPVQPGEPGRIVVTDLTGKLMPFIRYEQGDRVVFKEMRDGRGDQMRKLTRIAGREDDYVLLPDGRRCTFDVIYETVEEYPGIAQFRIVQRSRDLYQIFVVAEPSYVDGIREDLTSRLKAEFVRQARYEIIGVNRIDPDPSGKTRIFISEAD